MREEQVEVSINPEDKVIKFKKRMDLEKCKHWSIKISVKENTVHCNDCNTDLNPVWWIHHHLDSLNSLNIRNRELLAQKKVIDEKFKHRRYYVCEHCNEPNMIDFSRLTSDSAIEKKKREIDEGLSLKGFFRVIKD